ncbi:MAG: hypothetical protein AAF447_04415 [Myxococcota bacterium]
MDTPNATRRAAALAIALVLASGVGLSVAQPSTEDEPAGSLEVETPTALTPDEQLAQARAVLEQGRTLSRRVSGLLAEARQSADIIRVTCVNDKLTQVNANVRTLESRVERLEGAVESEDSGRRNHEYTVIAVLGQKLQVLSREANQCVGQDLYETGATTIEVSIDDATPTEDPAFVGDTPAMGPPVFVPPGSGVS